MVWMRSSISVRMVSALVRTSVVPFTTWSSSCVRRVVRITKSVSRWIRCWRRPLISRCWFSRVSTK
jgi:hypothetical protein